MVALLKREVTNLLGLFGGRKAQHGYEPNPCGEIDYDSLCDDVAQRYPEILKRLAE